MTSGVTMEHCPIRACVNLENGYARVPFFNYSFSFSKSTFLMVSNAMRVIISAIKDNVTSPSLKFFHYKNAIGIHNRRTLSKGEKIFPYQETGLNEKKLNYIAEEASASEDN